jgi:pyrroline-5-carboxylate reductase
MKPADIIATDKRESSLEEMKKLGVTVSTDNLEAVKAAEVVLLAVKPYHIAQVIDEIKSELNSGKILMSIVAGVSIGEISEMAGKELPVFRVMPNTAIALQESLTCISSNKNAALTKNMFSKCSIN